jgi:ATP-dependent RNA helicase RhlE
MQFTDFTLDARLQRAVQAAGYAAPTPIQERTIPLGLSGQDVIGTAQTGTGKTAAFVLPILNHLLNKPAVKPGRARALIVTPTRELAEQINTTIRQLAQFTNLRSATVYGGVGMQPQERALRAGVEIIVACPGRLLDHIDHGATLEGIELLVLDEADRMLDMGFLPSVRRILSYVPRQRQTMLFSATFAPELSTLAAQTLRNPTRVDVGVGAPAKTIAHALYPVPQHLKTALVLTLLKQLDTNSVLIFTRTKHRANRVAQQIERSGYAVAALHSNKSQNQRQLALDSFRSGKVRILVATDIAARGLDIASISHVINYDIPDTADTYIHRIGRTGRAERDGDAMTLVTSEDAVTIRDIERTLRTTIERRKVAGFDYDAPAPTVNEFQRPPQQFGGRGGQPRAQTQHGAQPARSQGQRPSGQPRTPQRGPDASRRQQGVAAARRSSPRNSSSH